MKVMSYVCKIDLCKTKHACLYEIVCAHVCMCICLCACLRVWMCVCVSNLMNSMKTEHGVIRILNATSDIYINF